MEKQKELTFQVEFKAHSVMIRTAIAYLIDDAIQWDDAERLTRERVIERLKDWLVGEHFEDYVRSRGDLLAMAASPSNSNFEYVQHKANELFPEIDHSDVIEDMTEKYF